TPIPSSTPPPVGQKTNDPLAELEKALAEYEARQKQQLPSAKAKVTQADTVSQTSEDPLKELGRVLDEYEANYKKRALAKATDQNIMPAPEPTTKPAIEPVVESTTQLASEPTAKPAAQSTTAPEPVGEVITPEEYQSVLKDTPAESTTAKSSTSSPVSTTAIASQAEPIEEQNIFELLGVLNSDSAEQEAFLDELQQAIWDDFLDKDLSLLVNPAQLKEVQSLREQAGLAEADRQEQQIAKVKELVPDIEEIMLEKALALKEEMVNERLSGMKEYFAGQTEKLAQLTEAEQYFQAGRWRTGAKILNSLSA
ncbi:MAG TPA: hypothetical protein VGA89_00435, partial [Patescibacteria group bacterium]